MATTIRVLPTQTSEQQRKTSASEINVSKIFDTYCSHCNGSKNQVEQAIATLLWASTRKTCNHHTEPETGEEILDCCGLALDAPPVRDLAVEIGTHQPAPAFLLGGGLGTDIRKTISAIRGPKQGGSLSRINKRVLKGDMTPRHIMESQENRISPEGSKYADQNIDRDLKERVLVENSIAETVSRIIQQLPGYKPTSAQWMLWANESTRKAIKQFREDQRLHYTEPKGPDGITLSDEFSFAAIKEVVPANVIANGVKKNGN